MREIKFRAWSNDVDDMFFKGDEYGTTHDYDCINYARSQNVVLMQYAGRKDIEGSDIYEGDFVYLAGYGNYECVFPFLELYDAGAENDIGKILGNIYQNPELLGDT